MKKIVFLSIFLLGLLLFKSVNAAEEGYIQSQLSAAAGAQGAGFSAPKDPRLIIASVVEVVLGFVGILFVSYLIYGGMLIITSGGEEDKITKGKNILVYNIIGIIIVLSAFSLVLFVERYLKKAQAPVNEAPIYAEWDWQSGEYQEQFQNNDPLNRENPANY